MDKDKSMFAYDNDDYDIREDVMDYDEDGAGWCSYMFLIKIICALRKFFLNHVNALFKFSITQQHCTV